MNKMAATHTALCEPIAHNNNRCNYQGLVKAIQQLCSLPDHCQLRADSQHVRFFFMYNLFLTNFASTYQYKKNE